MSRNVFYIEILLTVTLSIQQHTLLPKLFIYLMKLYVKWPVSIMRLLIMLIYVEKRNKLRQHRANQCNKINSFLMPFLHIG